MRRVRIWRTYPLNSIALLLGDRNGLGAGRQGDVVFGILAEQLEESVGVRGNELGKLGVASAKLLQDWLQHLGLLLYNLAELLELRIGAQEIQVSEVSTGGGSGSISAAAAGSTSTTGLSGEIEQVDAPTLLVATGLCRLRRNSSWGGRGGGSGSGGLPSLLLLLDVVGDALTYVLAASKRLGGQGARRLRSRDTRRLCQDC